MGDAFDDLVARARRGDETAFLLVFRDVQPALLAFLRVRDPGFEEDLASETWAEVARGLSRFRGDERGFRGWVFTIARQRAIDAARSRARRPVTAPESSLDVRPAGPSHDPAELVEAADTTRRALALLAALPPDQADVVLLRVVTGLSNAEVAEIVGKSEGAVRVTAHRALRRLAARIDAAELLGVTGTPS